MMKNKLLLAFLLLFCTSASSLKAQKFIPPAGKTLLILGQDLTSVNGYVSSGHFPTPSGITSYVDFYNLANATAYFPYAGLGEKTDGSAAPDINWGAGPLNTRNAALGYPNSVLVLGLSLVEDYAPNGLSKIVNGDYDTEIIRLANFIKDKKKPVYVRIGYEFDGKWNTGYANTANYKNAYKKIVNIIRPIAPNFVSVWQACTSPVDDILEGYHEDISNWYPGDEFVDWMGYSWFLNTSQQISLTNELIDYARLRKKPVMGCESSPQGYDLQNLTYRYINTMLGGQPGSNPVTKTPDQIWNEWFKPYFDYIHANSDVIRAAAYISANWDAQGQWGPPYSQGYWGDSRVEVNAVIRSKWNTEISSSFWIPGSSQLFSLLTGNVVKENAFPVVSFKTPVNNQTIKSGEGFVVEITATDDDTITSVKLSLDGNLVGTKNLAPFVFQNTNAFKNLTVGPHLLKTEVTDNHKQITTTSISITVYDPGTISQGRPYAPQAGKTLLLIGQTYTQEYKDYITGTGKAPAGSSHYGEIYNGKINQGDDANNESFLEFIETTYPNAYAQLAISIKDNPAAGGYSGENAVWKALMDVVTGKFNSQIDAVSASMKNRPSLKFLLRIDYEVSLNMFVNKTITPFVEILNKYNNLGINPLEKVDQIAEFDLTAYKNAYNYIAKRIRETNQVSNVEFVYHSVRGFSDTKWLYPGDQYVDWYGISLFNHDMCYPTWEGANPPFVNCPQSQSMDANVKQCLDWAKTTIRKPIIISESAVQAELSNQHNATFMNGYLDKVANLIETYDVKAWVYINSNWVAHNWSAQWGDSRVQTIPSVKTHWINEVSKPRYIHYDNQMVTGLTSEVSAETLVYPNPFDNILFIKSPATAKIEIFTLSGIKMIEKTSSGECELRLDLLPGNYILKMTDENQVSVKMIYKN